MDRNADALGYTESTALLTALDWTGLIWIKGDWDLVGVEGRVRQVQGEGVGGEGVIVGCSHH